MNEHQKALDYEAKREYIGNDMNVSNFATLSAIKGSQFGKEVFSSVIKFKDIDNFLTIFPDVQREVVPKKVSSIRKYIRTGLKDLSKMRFFSAITVSCRGQMLYDEINRRVAIDISNSKLSVNDGQHRILAIKSLIEHLDKEAYKTKDESLRHEILSELETLREMTLPLIIFNNLTESEEKQLFHDLNSLAQRPSRNSNIKLNQTDLCARISNELSESNRYLKHYGVEYHKMSIHKNNPNTILLTTVYHSVQELVKKSTITEDNYNDYKEMINETFDKIFFNLPNDINVKGKYFTDRSYTLKAISKFIFLSRKDDVSDDIIFKVINSIDWSYNISYWKEFGAVQQLNGIITFGGNDTGGKRAVLEALKYELKKLMWSI